MTDKRLRGKTALVTAAGQGIGRAAAELFASQGAAVLATDINADLLANLAGCRSRRLDVTDPAEISAAISEIGPLDILFNCAGYVHSGTILDCDELAWKSSLDINVTSMYRLIAAVLPGMLERGRGSIINMSSVAGSIKGVPNRFVYGVTKAAVIGLTRSIAADYVAAGVRCSINADDPLLFGPGLLEEYELCRDELGLDDDALATVATASVEASGAPADLKARAIGGIATWLSS